jgi:hypothetical protein
MNTKTAIELIKELMQLTGKSRKVVIDCLFAIGIEEIPRRSYAYRLMKDFVPEKNPMLKPRNSCIETTMNLRQITLPIKNERKKEMRLIFGFDLKHGCIAFRNIVNTEDNDNEIADFITAFQNNLLLPIRTAYCTNQILNNPKPYINLNRGRKAVGTEETITPTYLDEKIAFKKSYQRRQIEIRQTEIVNTDIQNLTDAARNLTQEDIIKTLKSYIEKHNNNQMQNENVLKKPRISKDKTTGKKVITNPVSIEQDRDVLLKSKNGILSAIRPFGMDIKILQHHKNHSGKIPKAEI